MIFAIKEEAEVTVDRRPNLARLVLLISIYYDKAQIRREEYA